MVIEENNIYFPPPLKDRSFTINLTGEELAVLWAYIGVTEPYKAKQELDRKNIHVNHSEIIGSMYGVLCDILSDVKGD